jgi:hypothetical protein
VHRNGRERNSGHSLYLCRRQGASGYGVILRISLPRVEGGGRVGARPAAEGVGAQSARLGVSCFRRVGSSVPTPQAQLICTRTPRPCCEFHAHTGPNSRGDHVLMLLDRTVRMNFTEARLAAVAYRIVQCSNRAATRVNILKTRAEYSPQKIVICRNLDQIVSLTGYVVFSSTRSSRGTEFLLSYLAGHGSTLQGRVR